MASNLWTETIQRLEEEEKHLQAAVAATKGINAARGAEDFVPITAAQNRGACGIALDVIAREIRTMPYGDMIELAKAGLDSPTNAQINETADRLWAWCQTRG